VGFRPFVYRIARENQIAGWVRNTSWGVEMAAEGEAAALDAFVHALRHEIPPLARIDALTIDEATPDGLREFEILHSEAQTGAYQPVSPDTATCADCLHELLDPADRRYRYPFINCTNCGPRFTIIEDVPYDRPLTTMRAFDMCPTCRHEYDDPLDRRFHAQPNACPVCGPHVTLMDADGRVLAERDDALRRVAALLREGAIVAVKGLGGYQLACDATDAAAVIRLRQRKRRPHKPYAVMVTDLEEVRRHAEIDEVEAALLGGPAAPIVLLPWWSGSSIVREVAPHMDTIGLMLPYTPLHHILLRDTARPLVMTSGNLSEEPIARDNDEALRRLKDIADYYLVHNRDIHSRYDDSVWFVAAGEAQPVRRARGYAPDPIGLPFEARPILAVGGELKNAFCLTRDRYAFVSQHIGDMENLETLEHFGETLALYRRLFRVEPAIVAHDMHPDYATTRYALEQPGEHVAVQHHHAHLAACLTDAGMPDEPAIGVIMDGTGYGLDGHIRGSEFLLGDARGYRRAAHLAYLPLPGGDAATRRPNRIALAYMQTLAAGDDLPPTLRGVSAAEVETVRTMIARGLNTPFTSSAGRLFDAVSALLGVCGDASYEAQAAIELEEVAQKDARSGDTALYEWETAPAGEAEGGGITAHIPPIQTRILRLERLWGGILNDIRAGVPVSRIACRFHRTLARMIADTCIALRRESGLNRVALSGGCFQNRLLLTLTLEHLQDAGFTVLTHRRVPCNDGGLALGQAMVAHYQTNNGG